MLTRTEYYHMILVRVFLTVEATYFLSEKGQRIHRMSATLYTNETTFTIFLQTMYRLNEKRKLLTC
jgi:hypothetical protein